MTYAIANSYNTNYQTEQTRWQFHNGAVLKIAAWSVPAGIHTQLEVPSHIDLYLSENGYYTTTLTDAIAALSTINPHTQLKP